MSERLSLRIPRRFGFTALTSRLTVLFFRLLLELDTTRFNEDIVCNILENLLVPGSLLMFTNGGRVSQQQFIFNDSNIRMSSETHFSRQQQMLCNGIV
jgi:hypothetical protein